MNRPRRLLVFLFAIMACATIGQSAATLSAAEKPDSWAAEGRQAFSAHGTYPWYDASEDRLQPISMPPQLPNWNLNLGWLAYVMLGLTALVVALLLVLILRWLRFDAGFVPHRPAGQHEELVNAEHVEALAFLHDRARGDLLGEARRHYLAGNYNEAIIYLFSYELVRLDRSALIHLARGKTNYQYLREAGKVQSLKQLLEATMTAFEDVFFGQRSLERGRFEACWDRLAEFEHLVTQASP